MDLKGRTALVLGGAGLVGRAVCRELVAGEAGAILVGGLTEAESREAIGELLAEHAEARVELIPVWGDLFARAQLADRPLAEIAADPVARRRMQADDLEELTPEVFAASHLVQLVLGTSPLAPGRRPDIIVDTVNTATVLAYGGLYQTIGRVLARRDDPSAPGSDTEDADALLASLATPRLVRHIQLLSGAMIQAGTGVYVKVGTTGTGGMGLNIPYTHGEEKPSRVLLGKAALAGAHSMLLFLLARTPGAPAVKEVKPAAAITWKRIAYGPVHHRGRPIRLFDCLPDEAVRLVTGAPFALAGAGAAVGGALESVFIDTGENGLFSLAEFTAITSLGQMEAVTPEEIAVTVTREIRGQSTGRDVVAALDGAVMGPSYRAGALRAQAIAEARDLVEAHGVPSVAFEILGPPRLSKLLYEAALLRYGFGSLEAVAAETPESIATRLEETAHSALALRRAALSVGIPILLSDGATLLAADRGLQQHRWERPGWSPTTEAIERFAHAEWIDLRAENAARWQARAQAILAEQRALDAAGATSSRVVRRFRDDPFDLGEIAAWIFVHEDGGERIVR